MITSTENQGIKIEYSGKHFSIIVEIFEGANYQFRSTIISTDFSLSS